MATIRKAASAVLFAAIAWAVPAVGMAQDQDQGVYLGLTFGQSKFDGFCTNLQPGVTCKDTDTAFRFLLGYQFNKNFAIEGGYHQLGEVSARAPSGATLNFEASTLEILAVATLPLSDKFSVYGKAGLYLEGDTTLSG